MGNLICKIYDDENNMAVTDADGLFMKDNNGKWHYICDSCCCTLLEYLKEKEEPKVIEPRDWLEHGYKYEHY